MTKTLDDIFSQAEKANKRREEMHAEAMDATHLSIAKHNDSLRDLIIIAAIRPLVELAILIVLIFKL